MITLHTSQRDQDLILQEATQKCSCFFSLLLFLNPYLVNYFWEWWLCLLVVFWFFLFFVFFFFPHFTCSSSNKQFKLSQICSSIQKQWFWRENEADKNMWNFKMRLKNFLKRKNDICYLPGVGTKSPLETFLYLLKHLIMSMSQMEHPIRLLIL